MEKAKNIHEIKIEIKEEEWKKVLDDTFKKLVKTAKIDGFRPGKAPRSVFEKKYGKQTIVIEAVDAYMQKAYEKAVKELKEAPIITPTASIEKADEDSVIYVFTFTTKPEVVIKKYKGLGVKKEKVKVTSKDIDNEIEEMKKQYADLEVKAGKASLGDTVIIDFEGFDGDKAFEGGKAENYALELGSNSFIPGFEDALVGTKAGDEKDIKISFPEDYHAEELKGKPVVFKTVVHEVKTKVYPELNEDFFLDLGLDNVKTEEDLKKMVKETLTEQKEYDAENKYIDELFDALLKNVEVELPHELIHEEIDHMVEEYGERLKMQGVSLEQFLAYTNSTVEKLKEQMHDEAEKRVKLRFTLNEIIALEKIEVTDEEVETESEKKASKYNMDKEEYVKAFGGLEMIKYDMKVQKVIDMLGE